MDHLGDLADSFVFDQVLLDSKAGEYVAALGCPDCSSFSRLHNLPGPPPLRSVSGPGRYGLNNLSPEQAEKVRIHNLVCLRVAKVLEVFTDLRILWMFETVVIYDKQVSVAHLD